MGDTQTPDTLESLCRIADTLVRHGRVNEALRRLEAAAVATRSLREGYFLATWARDLRARYPLRPAPGVVCFPAVDATGQGSVFRVRVRPVRGQAWTDLEARFARPLKAGVCCVDFCGVGRSAFDFDLETFAPAFEVIPGLDTNAVHLSGRSFEGALALAVVSAAAGRPLNDRQWAVTGAVEHGALLPVPAAGLTHKVTVVQAELGAEVALVSTRTDAPWPLDEVARHLLGLAENAPDAATSLDTLERWMDEDRSFTGWPEAERIARAVLERTELEPAERVRAARYLASALNHQGRAHEGLTAFEHAGETLDEASEERARRVGGAAISYLDLDRVGAAIDLIEREIRDERRETPETIRGRVDAVHLLGTLARCYSAAGRDEEAVQTGRLAVQRAPADERDRNLADLGFWLFRAGRLDEAAARLAEAEAHARDRRGAAEPTVSDLYRASFAARVANARGERVAEADIRAGLRYEPLYLAPVVFGWLEVACGHGLDVAAEFVRIDGTFGSSYSGRNAIARLRARAELHRPAPDLSLVEKLSGEWRAGERPADRMALLSRRLPY